MLINRAEHYAEQHGLRVEWTYARTDPNYPSGGMAPVMYWLWLRLAGQPWVLPRGRYKSLVWVVDFLERSRDAEEILAELFPTPLVSA